MTLYRQLLIFTLILFLLLFAGTWIAKLSSTRTFLLDQLESHAQDTATSLGLSISPHMEDNDLPAIETMINAVFDRGYYRTIRLTDIDGGTVLDRTLEVTIEGVPAWFIRLVPLTTPHATALVLAGWRQAGEVRVESHPGYAYKTLWETAVRTTAWFALMGALVLFGGGFGLRLLLKPLKRVEHQAETLCKRQYEIQEKLPRTRELRRVVEAMNRMTFKVKEMFEEQARIAERLRKNAYHDDLTGLGNRRYLEGQVSTRLDRGESAVKGAFLLLQVNNLQEINQRKGFQAGDELLRQVAAIVQKHTVHAAHCALARLTGGDFGLFLPDAVPSDAEYIAAEVSKGLAQLAATGLPLGDNVGQVGGVVYSRATEFSQLLAGADTALHAAQSQGGNAWHIDSLGGTEAPRGQQQWREMLTRTLERRDIHLFGQKTVHCEGPVRVLHLEVFSRIREESGNLISAGMFMPLAERLGLVATLDRIVLEKAMLTNTATLGVGQMAVNISPSSLGDASFRDWLLEALRKLPPTAPRLRFEFVEFSAVQQLELVRTFGSQVQELGHGYGLDHFGHGFANFGYLKSLRPDYVKIDRAYTDELRSRDSDSYFFIGSLASVAHSLDILVIAEGVETEEQFNLLRELNLDAIQGYYISRPEPVVS